MCETELKWLTKLPFDPNSNTTKASRVPSDAIVQKMMAGLGRPLATVVHPAAFGYDPSVTPYTYDPKKSKELLKQAGYPNGVDVTIHSGFVEFRPVFEAICQMLTEVGIGSAGSRVRSSEKSLPATFSRILRVSSRGSIWK